MHTKSKPAESLVASNAAPNASEAVTCRSGDSGNIASCSSQVPLGNVSEIRKGKTPKCPFPSNCNERRFCQKWHTTCTWLEYDMNIDLCFCHPSATSEARRQTPTCCGRCLLGGRFQAKAQQSKRSFHET